MNNMSYTEDRTEQFYHFSSTEEDIIDGILKDLGYTWDRNKVCGNCCGMYADNYYVDGVGGTFKEEDKKNLIEKYGKTPNIEVNIIDILQNIVQKYQNENCFKNIYNNSYLSLC